MSISTEPIILACAADDFFAMPLAVTIRSVMDHLNPNCQVVLYVLDGGIRPSNQQRIEQSLDTSRINIHWVKPSSDRLEAIALSCQNTYPVSAYYRLLLPEIIPETYNRVIYLDTDLIVQANLETLWRMDFGDYHLLAAMDAANRNLYWPKHLKHLDLKKMGVTEKDKYLQSGVLVIDLKKWRAEGIADQVIKFIANHTELPYPDQDALNFVLAGKWYELDPRWNQIPVVHHFNSWQESPYTEQQLWDVINDPFIIHYGSRPKPWNRDCAHPQKSLWYDSLNKTAWSGWQDTNLNHMTRLLRKVLRRLSRITKRFIFSNKLLSIGVNRRAA
ncbi:MAG: glycosyltransferase family 8 protein [Cyanobacteria bacterium J06592_8]